MKHSDIEAVADYKELGKFKYALFDFDGTISLIREGWQDIMKPYFFGVLKSAPGAGAETDESIMKCVHDFVDLNTGKQTIYQCMELANEVRKRGGEPLEPLEYKEEYHRRLLERIQHRLDGLKKGDISPADMVVPGAFEFLEALYRRGIKIYLASGTDEKYVLNEAELLGVTKYFTAIYGAKDDYRLFSKKMVVQKIINENGLHGSDFLGFGDGYVEIENVKEAGGFAVGVASDEAKRSGVDEWKRGRLIKAGADIIIPDYRDTQALEAYIFKEG
jgi:phosphoglycolate phosphatase